MVPPITMVENSPVELDIQMIALEWLKCDRPVR
jgi:hypothetical protein